MPKKNLNILLDRFWSLFVFVWGLLIFMFYWSHHPNYYFAFQLFQYSELLALFGIGVFGILGGFILFKRFPFLKKVSFNGVRLWFLFFLITVGLYTYQCYIMDAFSIKGGSTFFSKMLSVQLFLYFLTMLCFSLGDAVLTTTNRIFQKVANRFFIAIGLGIISITFLLMGLGVFHLLCLNVLFPIFLGILIVTWKNAWFFLKKTIWQPINFQELSSPLGILSFVLLVFWLQINFMSMLRPIPLGYDSLTLYFKIPALIQDYGALVSGNMPYNWSLFMALGYLFFEQTEYVLGIAFLGSVLALLALFQLLKYLLSADKALFSLLLFYSLPAINHLSYADMKPDLALLFFLTCCLLIIMEVITMNASIDSQKIGMLDNATFQKVNKKTANDYKGLPLLGIFSGYAIGIKLTAMLLVFAILCWLAFRLFKWKGFIGTFLMSLFMILFLRLDNINGLTTAFLSRSYVQWFCLLSGLGLLIYLLKQDWRKVVLFLKQCGVYLLFLSIAFAPWPFKNYMETKELKMDILLYGKHHAPIINMDLMEKKWQTQYGTDE